jgi:hypothetical protein
MFRDQVIELVLFPTGRSVFDSTKVAHHCRCGDGDGVEEETDLC